MSFTMTVSPDFSADNIAGWYIFNTYLQRQLDIPIHLELYNSFEEQRKAIANDKIDLIFSNPYDASMPVREKALLQLLHRKAHQMKPLLPPRQIAISSRLKTLMKAFA